MNDFILLIPYFNNYNGLISSINSINYPPDKYGILIVDDGSKSELNIQELEKLKPETSIKVIRLPQNQGIAKALNTGLAELHKRNDYKYIARLDCGDTCHPERFTAQVNFMDDHSEIALLGSWCKFTDIQSGKSYIYKTKLTHTELINEMHFKCSFIHPTVIFRREILDAIGYYPENYPHAEDYAFFWNILKRFDGAILSEIYVTIAMSTNTVSARNFREQLLSRKRIVRNFGTNLILKYLGILGINFRLMLPSKFITKTKFWLYN